ncbi:hypothetical protein HDU76_000745, partial [Blyttiomyces sp. JEL0837]
MSFDGSFPQDLQKADFETLLKLLRSAAEDNLDTDDNPTDNVNSQEQPSPIHPQPDLTENSEQRAVVKTDVNASVEPWPLKSHGIVDEEPLNASVAEGTSTVNQSVGNKSDGQVEDRVAEAVEPVKSEMVAGIVESQEMEVEKVVPEVQLRACKGTESEDAVDMDLDSNDARSISAAPSRDSVTSSAKPAEPPSTGVNISILASTKPASSSGPDTAASKPAVQEEPTTTKGLNDRFKALRSRATGLEQQQEQSSTANVENLSDKSLNGPQTKVVDAVQTSMPENAFRLRLRETVRPSVLDILSNTESRFANLSKSSATRTKEWLALVGKLKAQVEKAEAEVVRAVERMNAAQRQLTEALGSLGTINLADMDPFTTTTSADKPVNREDTWSQVENATMRIFKESLSALVSKGGEPLSSRNPLNSVKEKPAGQKSSDSISRQSSSSIFAKGRSRSRSRSPSLARRRVDRRGRSRSPSPARRRVERRGRSRSPSPARRRGVGANRSRRSRSRTRSQSRTRSRSRGLNRSRSPRSRAWRDRSPLRSRRDRERSLSRGRSQSDRNARSRSPPRDMRRRDSDNGRTLDERVGIARGDNKAVKPIQSDTASASKPSGLSDKLPASKDGAAGIPNTKSREQERQYETGAKKDLRE